MGNVKVFMMRFDDRCAGIIPDGSLYKVDDIRSAMATVLNGHLPGIECNKDQSGRIQLYQVYICVDVDGSTLIECPILPRNECKGKVEFPVFAGTSSTNRKLDAANLVKSI